MSRLSQAANGRKGGESTSLKKQRAARLNGRWGGRPRKKKPKPQVDPK